MRLTKTTFPIEKVDKGRIKIRKQLQIYPKKMFQSWKLQTGKKQVKAFSINVILPSCQLRSLQTKHLPTKLDWKWWVKPLRSTDSNTAYSQTNICHYDMPKGMPSKNRLFEKMMKLLIDLIRVNLSFSLILCFGLTDTFQCKNFSSKYQ